MLGPIAETPVPGPSAPQQTPEPGAALFVATIWVLLFAADLGVIVRDGSSFPRGDDFAMVSVLTHDAPLSRRWLWEQHNEHRVPLPKLLNLGLLELSNGDFRAGMFLSLGLLGLAALGLVLAARRARGFTRSTDAIFPLMLLHLGHQTNLLWCWQVQFTLSTALAAAVLALIVRRADWPGPRRSLLAGLLFSLLPLCGANGVAWVPALGLWLVAAAAARAGGDLRARVLVLLSAVPGLVITALVFRDYRGAGHHELGADLSAKLLTAAHFLSLVFGPAAEGLWPFSGLALAVWFGSALLIVARAIVVDPEERPRAFGLLAFLLGMTSLALGLGWGRAGAGANAGFESRYVTLAAPIGCACTFAWDLYGGPRALRHLASLTVLAAFLALVWPNTAIGIAGANELAAKSARLNASIDAGLPRFLVIKQGASFLFPTHDLLDRYIPRLQARRLRGFSKVRPNPRFRTIEVPVVPERVTLADWDDGVARSLGEEPKLLFVLPEERYVAGVRLHYSHTNETKTPARFKLEWWRGDQDGSGPDQRYADWSLPTGPDRTTTVWVGDRVRSLEIQPDNRPCEFRIHAIELLVPDATTPASGQRAEEHPHRP